MVSSLLATVRSQYPWCTPSCWGWWWTLNTQCGEQLLGSSPTLKSKYVASTGPWRSFCIWQRATGSIHARWWDSQVHEKAVCPAIYSSWWDPRHLSPRSCFETRSIPATWPHSPSMWGTTGSKDRDSHPANGVSTRGQSAETTTSKDTITDSKLTPTNPTSHSTSSLTSSRPFVKTWRSPNASSPGDSTKTMQFEYELSMTNDSYRG